MNKDNKALFNEFPEVTTQQWKDKIIKDLKGGKYEKLINKTDFGVNFEPFYRQEDLQEIPFKNSIPGQFPYVRGTEQNNNWLVRQLIKVSDIKSANEFAVKLLNTGVNSITYCFQDDLINSTADIKIILQNIDITEIDVNFKYPNGIFKLQKLFIQYVDENKIDENKLKLSLYYNPFASLLMQGQLPKVENDNLEILHQFVTSERLNSASSIVVGAVVFNNSGATVTQEIGFALSQAVEIVNKFTDIEPNGIEKILGKIEFIFATGGDYFVEIAKYRTVRMLWAKIVKQFGVEKPELQKIKLNAINSNWNKTIYDAHVNMLRVTTETMSAAIGGCNSISVMPYNATFEMPNDFSYRIAKNTQVILKEESYFDKIVDPAGGSYYIEKLTKEISAKAWEMFLDIENTGGFYANVLENKIQNQIEEAVNIKNLKISQGRISILGTNKYPNQEESANEKIKFNKSEINNNSSIKTLKWYRGAEAFENLRLKTENSNKTPKVFLYNTGNVVMSKARAMFSAGFFACAGFEIIESELSLTLEEGISEISKHNPDIVVACSSDKEYADFIPQLKEKLSDVKLVVAGNPIDLIEEFAKIGVIDYVNVKTNILETLTAFQEDILNSKFKINNSKF